MFQKHLSLLSLLLLITFFSCTKTNTEEVYVEPYVITGVSDLEFKKPSVGPAFANMQLAVEYKNSTQEYVQLSLEDVPAGMTYKFSPQGGYAGFFSTLSIIDSTTAPGTYVLKLKSKSDKTQERVYNINTLVHPRPVCIDGFIGTYSSSSSCFLGSIQSIIRDVANSNTAVFPDFLGTGDTVKAAIICDYPFGANDITIDPQNVTSMGQSYEVKGYGSYYKASNNTVYRINLSLQVKNLTTNTTNYCSVQLDR